MKKNLYIIGLWALGSIFDASGVSKKVNNLKRFSSFFNIPDVQVNKKDLHNRQQNMRIFCQNNHIDYDVDEDAKKNDEIGIAILGKLNSLSDKLGYTVREISNGQKFFVVDVSWPSIKNSADRVLAKYEGKDSTPKYIENLKKLLGDFGNIFAKSEDQTRTAIRKDQADFLLELCRKFFDISDADANKSLIEGTISKAILNYTGFQRIMSILTVGLLNEGDDGFCPGFTNSKIIMEDLSKIPACGVYDYDNHSVKLDPGCVRDPNEAARVLIHELTHLFNYMTLEVENYNTFYRYSIPFFIKSALANDSFRDMFFPAISKANLNPKNNVILKTITETITGNKVKFDRIKEVIRIMSSGGNEDVSEEEKKIFNILVKIVKHGFGEIVFGESWEKNMYDQLTPENFAVAIYIRILLFQDSLPLELKWTDCEEILTMFGMLPFLYKDKYVILENRQNEFSFKWRELQREGDVTERLARIYKTHLTKVVSLEKTLQEMLNLPSAPGPFHYYTDDYYTDEYNKLLYPENPVHTDSDDASVLFKEPTFILPGSYNDYLSNKIYNYDFFEDWVTLLYCAARSGNVEMLQFLLEEGVKKGLTASTADVLKAVDASGATPLHSAVKGESKEMVKFLIGAGVDVKACDGDGFTALHYAAKVENVEIVKLLLTNEADVAAYDKYGCVPLHYAANFRNKEIVELLLEEGTKKGLTVNVRDKAEYIPLHYAAIGGTVEILKFLMEKGAEITACDEKGLTALHYAITNQNMEMVKILLEEGVKRGLTLNIQDKDSMTTPYHTVRRENMEEMAKLLVEKGANMTAENRPVILNYVNEDEN
ncbi:MAG: ankyrin repeat domain-containing protein [Holosporaceae bacterium]|jgi:ankyrin repeat protein|nr:ankyrin repeat domain-containing protein [Holosporaceae bacterium]